MYSALASLLWSLNPAIIQKYGRLIKPIPFTWLRAVFASLVLSLVAIMPGRNLQANSMSLFGVLLLTASAIIGPGIGDAAYAKAIKLLGGSLAVIVSYTYIFVAQLLAVAVLGEKVTWGLAAGTAISFSGIILAVYRNSTNHRGFVASGLLYAFAASISWGIASFLIKPVYAEVPDPVFVTLMRLIVVVVFFMIAGLREVNSFNELKHQIVPASITGILGWGIGMTLFVYAIGVVGVSASVAATALTPVVSQITVALVNRVGISWRHGVGALLVALGILMTALGTV